MSLFLLFAVILLAVAVLFVLLPLMKVARARTSTAELITAAYRAQFEELQSDLDAGTLEAAQYEVSKRELEIRMQEDLTTASRAFVAGQAMPSSAQGLGKLALILGLALPVAAAGLYAWVGKPEAIFTANIPAVTAAAEGAPGGVAHEVTDAQIQEMVQKLADRLKNNPNDLEGWYMLARSMATLGRLPDALKALDVALKLAPNEPQLLADYADIYATINGGNLEGKPMDMIRKALKLDPKNTKALALAGTAAFRKKDYDKATEYWTLLKGALTEAGATEQVAVAESNINQARAAQGLPPLPSSTPATAPMSAGVPPMMPGSETGNNDSKQAAGPEQKIIVSVSLSPALAAKAAPGDTLFVFARAASGPRMPLAIIRTTASELPKTFTLDDSLAMSPMMKISDFPEVIVGARISKSGNALPQSGDLTTTSGPVKLGTQNTKLVIDVVTQ